MGEVMGCTERGGTQIDSGLVKEKNSKRMTESYVRVRKPV